MAMLTRGGYAAWFVGGCVRNALMGRPVSDIDVTTDARPDAVLDLAQGAGLRAIPTGIDHGTITVICDGTPFEITTFRRDVETDGRHARVTFSDSIEEDAARRDFTMNALYAAPDGRVVDPIGGLADLEARKVRFIGNPDRRIEEDYLRILRFFRFHAIYGDPGGGLDPEGFAACAAHVEGIARLSRERIGAEMMKLSAAPDPAPALASMQVCGVLRQVLPGAVADPVAILVHLEGQRPPDPIRRLAALGGEDVAERLRLSRADARRLAVLRDAALGDWAPAELGYRLGAADGEDAALVRAALTGGACPPVVLDALRDGAGRRFPVTAHDLMPEHEGPAIGRRLRRLEDLWIASGFRLTREALLSAEPDDG